MFFSVLKKSWFGLLLAILIIGRAAPIISAEQLPAKLKDSRIFAIKHIIVVIGDGMGSPQLQAAREYVNYGQKQPSGLTADSFPVKGMVSTGSLSGTTDSIAADTAMLTGHKTSNGIPFTSPDGTRYPTALEIAHKKGWSTGILTTSFMDTLVSSKNKKDQGMALLIAQQAAGAVDVLVASTGVKPAFLPQSQLAAMIKKAGYKVMPVPAVPAQVFAGSGKAPQRIAALQYYDRVYEIDRGGSGQQNALTAEAMLQALDRNPEGFLLIIHSAQIDRAAHNNDLAAQTREIAALDKTVSVCRRFYNNHPDDTVLIVVADHETGKLSLAPKKAGGRAVLLSSLNASVETIAAEYMSIGNDPFGFIDYLKKMGLSDLSRTELSKLGFGSGCRGSQSTAAQMGASVRSVINYRAGATYGTKGHSDQRVPLAALGRGTEVLQGNIDNTEIGMYLISVINGQTTIQTPDPTTSSQPDPQISTGSNT